MQFQKFSFVIVISLSVLLTLPSLSGLLGAGNSGEALAGESTASTAKGNTPKATSKKKQRRRAKRARKARKMKVCKRRKGKRRCRWVPRFDGHGVASSKLREDELEKPSGALHVYSVNWREEVKVELYDDDGEINPAALVELDNLFRCRRTGEERAVDPELYEVLATIYDHFGQKRIELVSGFRNQPNQGSRHFHASAMDIRIDGISPKKLYRFAESLDTGGMGIGLYPTSRFIHVDFRAPGEKSYRWTDYSGPGGKSKKRGKRRKRPNS